jgi:type I restriction enzyme M protein
MMNLYLHGLDDAKVTYGQDSLVQDPGQRYSIVLTNPPSDKKSSVSIANDLRPNR